jgi:hypothetical protein
VGRAVGGDAGAVVARVDRGDALAVGEGRALAGGELGEHVVELGALDLPRVRGRAREAVGEAEEGELAGALVDELGALLVLPARGIHLDAEAGEDREVDRQQRLADVEARERVLLDHEGADPGAREQVGGGRASGAGPDDHDVVHAGVIPCRR